MNIITVLLVQRLVAAVLLCGVYKSEVDYLNPFLAVLLDMQMHTLGGRMEIAALSPAPLQVSYLVFPGTSGARFFQYLLADAVVAPAEHAPYYSEALLLLPPSYQVSFYDRYEPAEALRALFGDVAESGREREMVAALRR